MFQINVFYHKNKVTFEKYGQHLGTFSNKHIFSRSSQEQPLPSGEGQYVLGAHGNSYGWGRQEVAVLSLWKSF